MRLIDADELIKGRIENDPAVIAAECAPTAYDVKLHPQEIRPCPLRLGCQPLGVGYRV